MAKRKTNKQVKAMMADVLNGSWDNDFGDIHLCVPVLIDEYVWYEPLRKVISIKGEDK